MQPRTARTTEANVGLMIREGFHADGSVSVNGGAKSGRRQTADARLTKSLGCKHYSRAPYCS